MCRRCGEPDRRPNAAGRRAQKQWLLDSFGDGTTAPCFWCETPLTWSTVQRDGLEPGGPYRRDNLLPACGPCNIARADASMPDGGEYGPVGDLYPDRHGRYPDETPASSPDQPREAAHREAADTAPIPRPRRPGERYPTRMAEPDWRRGRVNSTIRVQDDRAGREADSDVGAEPDLVVIDTADLDQLREQHPWLFSTEPTDDADTEATLRRIDSDLRGAENTRDAEERRHSNHGSGPDARRDGGDDRDAGYGW